MILESCLAGRFPGTLTFSNNNRPDHSVMTQEVNTSEGGSSEPFFEHSPQDRDGPWYCDGAMMVPWWCHDENAGIPDDVLSKRSMSHFADTLMHTVHMVHMVHTIGCRYVIFQEQTHLCTPTARSSCCQRHRKCAGHCGIDDRFSLGLLVGYSFGFAWFDIVLDSTCARRTLWEQHHFRDNEKSRWSCLTKQWTGLVYPDRVMLWKICQETKPQWLMQLLTWFKHTHTPSHKHNIRTVYLYYSIYAHSLFNLIDALMHSFMRSILNIFWMQFVP